MYIPNKFETLLKDVQYEIHEKFLEYRYEIDGTLFKAFTNSGEFPCSYIGNTYVRHSTVNYEIFF